jgi:hypothetical protein
MRCSEAAAPPDANATPQGYQSRKIKCAAARRACGTVPAVLMPRSYPPRQLKAFKSPLELLRTVEIPPHRRGLVIVRADRIGINQADTPQQSRPPHHRL